MEKSIIVELLLTLLAMKVAQQKILRLSCRREAMFKLGNRNHALIGHSSHVLVNQTVRGLKNCARKCTYLPGCMSFLFKSNITSPNCQLLNREIAGLTSTDIFQSVGWNIYEPVGQVTSRCQENICLAGTLCSESCQTLVGYTCEDIDECESNPCKNGGTCNNLANAYSCSCTVGWTGVNCETDVNKCSSYSCYNGGTCQQLTNGFICNCLSGFFGATCRKEIMGTISSDNYPNTYSSRIIQTWILEVTSGRVQLVFNDFSIMQDTEKVELREGRSKDSPLIMTMSGSYSPGSYYASTGNVMFVSFTAGSFSSRRGWIANWVRHY